MESTHDSAANFQAAINKLKEAMADFYVASITASAHFESFAGDLMARAEKYADPDHS